MDQSLGTPLGKGPVPRAGRSRRPVGANAWVVVTASVTVPTRRESSVSEEVHHSEQVGLWICAPDILERERPQVGNRKGIEVVECVPSFNLKGVWTRGSPVTGISPW